MSATPIRRHRFAASLAGVVLGLGLLAGCSGQRAPGGYSDKVGASFVQGCTATAEGDNVNFDAKTYCQCAYDALSGPGGVAFDEFKKVNNDQTEKPGRLPQSFTKVFASCSTESNGGSATTTTTTTSTQAPADDTTTTGG